MDSSLPATSTCSWCWGTPKKIFSDLSLHTKNRRGYKESCLALEVFGPDRQLFGCRGTSNWPNDVIFWYVVCQMYGIAWKKFGWDQRTLIFGLYILWPQNWKRLAIFRVEAEVTKNFFGSSPASRATTSGRKKWLPNVFLFPGHGYSPAGSQNVLNCTTWFINVLNNSLVTTSKVKMMRILRFVVSNM